jgi:hypothetical protein
MVSPWYKEAATTLKTKGIQFGAMDMDVHGKLGNSYGVSGMPHIMAFLPGDPENPVGMGGLGGAASIVNFAEEQFGSLSEEQRSKALAATLPPPPPAPPSTVEFFASLGLQEFSAGFVENGHDTTKSLSALDAYGLGELGMIVTTQCSSSSLSNITQRRATCQMRLLPSNQGTSSRSVDVCAGDSLGMSTKQILALSRGLRKLTRKNEL